MRIRLAFYYRILLLLMLGWSYDSMSAGIISGTLPLIVREYSFTPSITGVVLSSWLLGMLLGALFIGLVGDIFGRKKAIFLSMLLLGFFNFLSAYSNSWIDLSIYRVLAGIGSAGYMVVGSTLLTEFAPSKIRGMLITLLESSWAIGWLVAILFARFIAPIYGWRPVFFTSIFGLFLAPLIYFLVPESIRFLLVHNKIDEAKRIATVFNINLSEYAFEKASKRTILDIFKGKYVRRTIMLWIHWFSIALTYWGIFLWLPQILSMKGLSYVRSVEYSIIITLAQLPGYFTAAWFVDRIGRKKLLVLFMCLGGLGSFLFWSASSEFEVVLAGIMLSFFNLGAWGITYAYTPELYPTKLRSIASGWANSIGRIGGMLGPYIAGFLLASTSNVMIPFLFFAIMHFVSALTVALLGVETKQKRLEDIS